jgi:hypothetical protein
MIVVLMSRAEIAMLIEKHLATFLPEMKAQFGEFPLLGQARMRELMEREPEFRESIDTLCMRFAEHGIWPRLEADTARLVYWRLVGARQALACLAESPFCSAESQSIALHKGLEFLLVAWWHMAGRYSWIQSFVEESAEQSNGANRVPRWRAGLGSSS